MSDEDEKISLLLGMGFPDVQVVRGALRMSNGDVSDAVTYLTEQPLSSYSTVDDLTDVDMPDAGSTNVFQQLSNSDDGKIIEFPTTHLYDLESRLFVETWVIPYKKDQCLGVCLMAATKLAEKGLCESDESCQRFLDRCLPECFQKLLNSLAVRKWGADILEGVFNMVHLFLDLTVATLRNGHLPEEILRNSLSMVFDSETEWSLKTRHRNPEFVGEVTYAESPGIFESYGFLVDLINIFGNKGGYELLAKVVCERDDLDAGQLTGLLLPVANGARFMKKDVMVPLFFPCVEKAINHVVELEEKQLKGKRIKYCYQLLESVRVLCENFWPEEVERISSLHLQTIERMLKTPHFSARMVALKELAIIISHSEKRNSCKGMDADYIQDWMTDKAVLSLALEGNLDQAQYTGRMKELVEFLGPKLKEAELTRIWSLCEKASPHVVDNVHRIMVAAATRFNPHQFDHLLKLIRKSWANGNDRLREKLLSLIGQIGQDSRLGRTAERMLDVLWELARVPSLPPHLVHLAVEEHLRILNESASREQLRKFFINRCVEDIKGASSDAVYLPLKQLHHLCESVVTRNSNSYSKSEKASLSELNKSLEIVRLICRSLSKSHALAVRSSPGGKEPQGDTIVDGKYTHSDYMVAHLDLLQFLLKEGDIYLMWPRCQEIWDTLVANPKASIRDKETCFSWFSQCLSDLDRETQRHLFEERLLRLDASSLSPSAFSCFVNYFHAVNVNERKMIKNGAKMIVDCFDPLGLAFVWELVLECSDCQLADDAIRLLLDVSYLSLSQKLKKDPPRVHRQFISECYNKLEMSLSCVVTHSSPPSESSRSSGNLPPPSSSSSSKSLEDEKGSPLPLLPRASRRSCLQHIHRLLVVVERYISTVEDHQFTSSPPRVLVAHSASFLGKPVVFSVRCGDTTTTTTAAGGGGGGEGGGRGGSNPYPSLIVKGHSNERMKSIYEKIARVCSVVVDQIQQINFEVDSEDSGGGGRAVSVNVSEHEGQSVHQLLPQAVSVRTIVKLGTSSGVQLKELGSNMWNELPDSTCYSEDSSREKLWVKKVGGGSPQHGELGREQNDSFSPVGAPSASPEAGSSSSPEDPRVKEERKMPGVVMSSMGRSVYTLLYRMAELEVHKITEAVRRVLYLIPTDSLVADKLDSICSSSVSVASNRRSGNVIETSSSPVSSPAKRERTGSGSGGTGRRREANAAILGGFIDVLRPGVSPFRLRYNLEVLSSKIIPMEANGSSSSSNNSMIMMRGGSGGGSGDSHHFTEEFLSSGGFGFLARLLKKEALAPNIHGEVKRDIYFVVLQLLSFLLGVPVIPDEVGDFAVVTATATLEQTLQQQEESPTKVTTPKDQLTARQLLQRLSEEKCMEMVTDITRVAWASASGKLLAPHHPPHHEGGQSHSSSPPRRKSRENNNNSSTTTATTTSAGSRSSGSSENDFSSVCPRGSGPPWTTTPEKGSPPSSSSSDALIATHALRLLIAVLSLRPNLAAEWCSSTNAKEFLIHVLIGCDSKEVRDNAAFHFARFANVDSEEECCLKRLLTQVLLKARLPLWVSSTSAREATLRCIAQSAQYFELRSELLSNLSLQEQGLLEMDASQMIEDEINWLLNFTTTRETDRAPRPESGIASLRTAEDILIAGHMKLIGALLSSCHNADRAKYGEALIPLLLSTYLFPASKLVLEPTMTIMPNSINSNELTSSSSPSSSFRRCSAKCTGDESRSAAYALLSRIAVTSESNFAALSETLTSLHHTLDRESVKEFERCPVVEGRCASGYVGLKNGGATCYMNSVLQQLFLVPGVAEDILHINSDAENDDSLFFQLQCLFGHLRDSQLQYFTPDKFWSCFRMGGQPVNVREQQDAFEFYSRLTEQIDDHLKDKNHHDDGVFAKRFEGVYSIQRICHDCPHRYEREEPFLALNLTVTKHNDLRDSLDQFVKGELLDGDNAYYCEKCNRKRTAVIRTCIKVLPPVLVIQLKRFGYDWEASRALKFDDYFKFPWTIDMGEYTVDAEQDRGAMDVDQPRGADKDNLSMDPPKSPWTPQSPSTSLSLGGQTTTPIKNSPLKLSIPSPAKVTATSSRRNGTTTAAAACRRHYELVGVIVHSGQANAGHYYSYIKDRRGDPISNPNKSKWFKFNDTTVERIEMSDALLERECFGGTYRAKVSYDSSNPLPEERLRYWNGYMLFYDCVDEVPCNTPKTPKTPRVCRASRSLRSSAAAAASVRKNLSLGGSFGGADSTTRCGGDLSGALPSSTTTTTTTTNGPVNGSSGGARTAQTSLCELSELLEKGERSGIFRQPMPPRILATITHDNLTFLRDRDVFSAHYFDFVFDVCSAALECPPPLDSLLPVKVVSLGVKFLTNTYLRTRGKEERTVDKWLALLCRALRENGGAGASWAASFFSSPEGELHLLPLLLECPDKLVRSSFGTLLENVMKAAEGGTPDDVDRLVGKILSLLTTQVPTCVKTCEQYFILFNNLCLQGSSQCDRLLKLGGFHSFVQFLLGDRDSLKRRWSPVQAQEFGPLHNVIAYLILRRAAVKKEEEEGEEEERVASFDDNDDCSATTTDDGDDVLRRSGPRRDQWLREVVLAFREVVGGIPKLTEALKVLCENDSEFSFALLSSIMCQYGTAPSNLLKDLSSLLLELLSIEDSLLSDRVGAVLVGFTGDRASQVRGLLGLIDVNKDADSRRAYQCIKLIVSLSTRSGTAREQLIGTQSSWHWAVEWLRAKMEEHSATGDDPMATGAGRAGDDDLASGSNEDSNTKNFRRTTSAQWTLAEATALLSGMESMEVEMEVDREEEEEEQLLLEEIRESPES